MTRRKRIRLNDSPFIDGQNGDRDNHGRFTKGNKAARGHGRTFHQRRAAINRRLFNVEESKVEQIIATLEDKAAAGVRWAQELWWERVGGRPAPTPIREEVEAEADAAEAVADAKRRLRAAELMERLQAEPPEPVTELDDALIEDFGTLVDGGVVNERGAELLCVPYETLRAWLTRGQQLETKKPRTDHDRRCLRFLLAWRRGFSSYVARQVADGNVQILERLDPATYARKSADHAQDVERYDKDDRFL